MQKINYELMRESGFILATTLDVITKNYINPGISTKELSNLARTIICSAGAQPAFLGYHGFPETACISINEEVVHGIPSGRLIKEGDIVSIDCGVCFHGHYTDACRTIIVGEVQPKIKRLVEVAEESLNLGIASAIQGANISNISYSIQKHTERNGFRVSRNFTGHGIGLSLHLPPVIPNYGPSGRGPTIVEGNCFAIEPVIFWGSDETVLQNDRWTVKSKNNNYSAHFEDTVMVTENGTEILTRLIE